MRLSLSEAHTITMDALRGCPHYRDGALVISGSHITGEDWYGLQQHLQRCDAIGQQWMEETKVS
jgi:hypothetical protein